MNLGFGAYRVALGEHEHEAALRYALANGVTLIDTSTNATNGYSEQLVGSVVAEFDRTQLHLVSKCGYIQGDMLLAFANKTPSAEVVTYSSECYHSIAPDFISAQLSLSLQRLQTPYIDTYLLDNPQYYLYANVTSLQSRQEHLPTMMQRIYDAFVRLEHEVIEGRIRGYGISSNAFSLSSLHEHFLPYHSLIELARLAAQSHGLSMHHFTTVELPINLLEQDGLTCATWAKMEGIEVIANRPFNAYIDERVVRMASYAYPVEYERVSNEFLDLLESFNAQSMQALVVELLERAHTFAWAEEYDNFYTLELLPWLQRTLAMLDEESALFLAQAWEKFLAHYREMVLFECSQKAQKRVASLGHTCEESMQKCALEFLHQSKKIDTVLVGMRKVKYVQDALTIANHLLPIKAK
ncbi:MAG: hypothetical protein KU28_01280 [Sulfurovum sp. PC08-66]|nr:MAG: hypothetical protein KU28_01280 [Sulfurovum sp. PC08-66]KIM12585.1 MAG: hypothetical protein KU37_01395 [Sulfuricurvum sp. PC08-66]